jgi:hypothetical protein
LGDAEVTGSGGRAGMQGTRTNDVPYPIQLCSVRVEKYMYLSI